MIVEFTLSIEENDEPSVMEKVLEISKHIKQLGFKVNNVVIQGDIKDMIGRYYHFEAVLASVLAKEAAAAAAAVSKV